ncbi:MAG TPA: 3-hydroxyacyl-ACP dehydratase FabZ [Desulfobacteraceae bacterium]|nr:3-hydroxyacyl-ACP dehydratase FabZ [Desulfobacteraceae bacterium]
MKTRYNIQHIMSRLPHRYPFILIDRILDVEPDEKIVALKNVTINEPFFQGHFPQDPVMPGVLIVEAMAQAGGILLSESAPSETEDRLMYFTGMDRVKFRKPVVPGDQLIIEVKFLKRRSRVIKTSGIAFVDEKIVSEAEITAAFGEKP